ncbi:MAG TPA: arcadin 1 [Nitrososphaerales archaeon]|nr:arcadin 1 [Nitrososphaerales archaeon]
MVQVKVQRISSVTDPYTGLPAKQIELVEVRQRTAGQVYGMGAEENRMVQSMVSQLQGMGLMPQIREMTFPKITMVLTESEYDMFAIRLDVNEVYELEIKGGTLGLKPSTGV